MNHLLSSFMGLTLKSLKSMNVTETTGTSAQNKASQVLKFSPYTLTFELAVT